MICYAKLSYIIYYHIPSYSIIDLMREKKKKKIRREDKQREERERKERGRRGRRERSSADELTYLTYRTEASFGHVSIVTAIGRIMQLFHKYILCDLIPHLICKCQFSGLWICIPLSIGLGESAFCLEYFYGGWLNALRSQIAD